MVESLCFWSDGVVCIWLIGCKSVHSQSSFPGTTSPSSVVTCRGPWRVNLLHPACVRRWWGDIPLSAFSRCSAAAWLDKISTRLAAHLKWLSQDTQPQKLSSAALLHILEVTSPQLESWTFSITFGYSEKTSLTSYFEVLFDTCSVLCESCSVIWSQTCKSFIFISNAELCEQLRHSEIEKKKSM